MIPFLQLQPRFLPAILVHSQRCQQIAPWRILPYEFFTHRGELVSPPCWICPKSSGVGAISSGVACHCLKASALMCAQWQVEKNLCATQSLLLEISEESERARELKVIEPRLASSRAPFRRIGSLAKEKRQTAAPRVPSPPARDPQQRNSSPPSPPPASPWRPTPTPPPLPGTPVISAS